MSLEEINKWLNNEYGVSYTKLEELHDFYFEKYCDLKQENEKLKAEYGTKVQVERDLLQQENQKYKEVIDKAINNSQDWIDFYTKLNSDERIALRLQENIDILKEVE